MKKRTCQKLQRMSATEALLVRKKFNGRVEEEREKEMERHKRRKNKKRSSRSVGRPRRELERALKMDEGEGGWRRVEEGWQ